MSVLPRSIRADRLVKLTRPERSTRTPLPPAYGKLTRDPEFAPRAEFRLAEHPHYVPSHEARAMQRLPALLASVDAVLEVRDARAPFASATTVEGKMRVPRIVILNKSDLVAPDISVRTRRVFETEGVRVVSTSAMFQKNIGKIKSELLEMTQVKFGSLGLRVAVIGMPNMGKSSLIEALKIDTVRNTNLDCISPKLSVRIQNTKTLKTAKLPGTTQTITEFLIHHKPQIKIMDTPGVTYLKDHTMIERNVKLAALGIYPDHILGERNIADYLLWRLNAATEFSYVELFGMAGPTDGIDEVLLQIGRLLADASGAGVTGKRAPAGGVDVLTAARCFIRNFREGKLGKICLDHIPTEDELKAADALEFVTEPPSPWGPESYADGEGGLWKNMKQFL